MVERYLRFVVQDFFSPFNDILALNYSLQPPLSEDMKWVTFHILHIDVEK